MSCEQCKHEKTLYDKTVARRIATLRRGTKRALTGLVAVGLLGAASAAGLSPVQATVPTTDYGGFSTIATASPLKLEVFEPAIPIPQIPQFELDFSYTRVLGDSGPTTSARASAMWPGPSIGEGLKTFGDQLGFPPQLTQGGYPVQVNSQFPGDPSQQASEPLPGMVQRVNATAKRTTAKAGYTASGDLADGDAGDGTSTTKDPLTALAGGDLSALGNLLTGTKSGSDGNPVQTNPLGALSLLIDFDGMTSVSSSDYDGTTAVATATSRIGELRLLLGLIKLTGVNVVTKVTSTLDGGAKTSQVVDVGGMTIAGQKFSFGPDGFTAAGKATPVPGLPDTAAGLLEKLGVKIEVPKPVITKDGTSAKIDAEAVRITLDTKPLRSLLPSLPLDQLVNNLPDLPGQANLLKGLLLSLNTISPKLVLHLGQASALANTVPAIDLGGGSTGTGGGDVSSPTGTGGAGTGTPGTGAGTGEIPPAATGDQAPASGETNPVPKLPGLPPLGSVPMLLTLAGLALAGGVGWYLKMAGNVLFGGAAACAHGLKAGIPDLRKV
jgi:hypothetical protein